MAVYQCTISMVDAYGRAVSKRVDVSADTHALAVTAAGAFVTDLQALTEAEVLYYSVAERVTFNGSLTAGANRDEGVTFSVRTTDNEKSTIKVPAPKNAIFNTDGSVDTANALVTDFIANYLSAAILVDDGEIVTSLIGGRLDE